MSEAARLSGKRYDLIGLTSRLFQATIALPPAPLRRVGSDERAAALRTPLPRTPGPCPGRGPRETDGDLRGQAGHSERVRGGPHHRSCPLMRSTRERRKRPGRTSGTGRGSRPRNSASSPGSTSTTWPAATPTARQNSATTASTTGFPTSGPPRSTTSAASSTGSPPGLPPSIRPASTRSCASTPRCSPTACSGGSSRSPSCASTPGTRCSPTRARPSTCCSPGTTPRSASACNSLAGRLAAVPGALAAARESLRQMPKVHLETAIAQFGGTIGLVDRGSERGAAPGDGRHRREPGGRGGRRRGGAGPASRARRARRAQGLAVGQARGR